MVTLNEDSERFTPMGAPFRPYTVFQCCACRELVHTAEARTEQDREALLDCHLFIGCPAYSGFWYW